MIRRLWHRFWLGFHRARADSWDRQLDRLYREHRLSTWRQARWDNRIRDERAKVERHEAP